MMPSGRIITAQGYLKRAAGSCSAQKSYELLFGC